MRLPSYMRLNHGGPTGLTVTIRTDSLRSRLQLAWDVAHMDFAAWWMRPLAVFAVLRWGFGEDSRGSS